MRFGEAIGGACAGIAISVAASAPAGADDAPLPPPSEARPPPAPEPAPAPVPWQQHIQVGGGVAFSQMLTSANADHVRFTPAVGFDVKLSFWLLRYLGVTGYVVEHDDPLVLPPGALGLSALNPTSAHTYSFGVHAAPTTTFGSRVRMWLIAGVGWGHIQYGTMTFAGTSSTCSTTAINCNVILPARSESFFEIPVGLGGSVEIIPRWLSLRLEVTKSFLPSQTGDALQMGQYINAQGLMANFNPMPSLDATYVETLSLLLHL
jgi:hypothetical protein